LESSCDRLRDELGLRPEHNVFLQVADFIPRKRHRDLLHAFVGLPSPARLLLAGDGPELEAMAKLANDLGIAERVLFLGIRADIPVLIKVADALILVSDQEGLPRCVLEAMAMARPVIGTRIRGTTDLIEEGGGILVPVGDPDAIAVAMRSIMDRPADARKMGMRGRQLVSQYDQARILTLHDHLYEQVLQ
jgi:glycosyltransferase involved in cell wall biosynthesis